MACDPDADRLALVDENGRPVGEELTLALAVKYILSKKKGNVVVNLSTSRVTEDVARLMGADVRYTPVGEANVVAGIIKYGAVIGGEGNGGVVYPDFHSGRDAMVGAAIIAGLLAETKGTFSGLTGTLPIYYNIKAKASLPDGFERKLKRLEKSVLTKYGRMKIDRRDGLRFDFPDGWFQIRKSNTEPIYRLIIETGSRKLTYQIKDDIFRYLR
jgi:phosphomannomutase